MYPCGVLQAFAIQAENIVRGTDRRADLDKGYKLLMDAILVAIERVALEHQKTPSDVVTMGTVCSYSPVGTWTYCWLLLLCYRELSPPVW